MQRSERKPMTTQDCIDEVVRKARELDPELWAKVDAIARIIDPSAFSEWYDGITPVEPDARVRYMRSVAENKAWRILQLLGIAPESYDWPRLFDALAAPAEREGGTDAR